MPNVKDDRLTLKGAFHKTANGRLSYEIYNATSEFIFVASKILHEQFGFSKIKSPCVGLDEVITECEKGDNKLLLGWDIWCGFYLMADSEAGDAIVLEVGTFFNSIIHKPEFDSYIHHW